MVLRILASWGIGSRSGSSGDSDGQDKAGDDGLELHFDLGFGRKVFVKSEVVFWFVCLFVYIVDCGSVS